MHIICAKIPPIASEAGSPSLCMLLKIERNVIPRAINVVTYAIYDIKNKVFNVLYCLRINYVLFCIIY